MATTTLDRAERPRISLKQRLERIAIGPVMLLVAFSFVLRAWIAWSLGTLQFSALPFVVQHGVEMISGLAMALVCELLPAVSGAKWYQGLTQQIRLLTQPGLSKVERAAAIKAARLEARINLPFMVLGFVASIGAGIWFAITATGKSDAMTLVTDLLMMFIITGAWFYFAVIYEPVEPDHEKLARARLKGEVQGVILHFVDLIRDGTYQNRHVTALQSYLPTQDAKPLEVLKTYDPNLVYLTPRQVAEFLQVDQDESKLREVRRRISHAAKNRTDLNIRQRADNRGWEMAEDDIMALFKDFLVTRLRG